MVRLLKRYYQTFFSEYYTYTIPQPIENVLGEVRTLITTRRPNFYVPNITGRISGYSFEAQPAWSFLYIKGSFDRSSAHLEGRLIAEETAVTRIELEARPNLSFFLMYLAGTVGTVIATFVGFRDGNIEAMIVGPLFLLIEHIVLWYGAYLCKKFLRETFEEEMGITPHT